MEDRSIQLYNRREKQVIQERVFERSIMDLLYGNFWFGRALCELVAKRVWFSKLYGMWQRRSASRKKIPGFISDYQVNVDEMLEDPLEYQNFDDFFCRKLKPEARPICHDQDALISVADARLLALKIDEQRIYPIKGKSFSLAELVPDLENITEYIDGDCLIFRLAPCDYHRFAYVDNGFQNPVRSINGHLHSVSPLSLRKGLPVFTGNFREYCVFDSDNFGQVLHIDVGALTVGRIIQHSPNGGTCQRGSEKGYFRIGGSTIVLLFKADKIRVDQDIVMHSELGIETIVKLGEKVGARHSQSR